MRRKLHYKQQFTDHWNSGTSSCLSSTMTTHPILISLNLAPSTTTYVFSNPNKRLFSDLRCGYMGGRCRCGSASRQSRRADKRVLSEQLAWMRGKVRQKTVKMLPGDCRESVQLQLLPQSHRQRYRCPEEQPTSCMSNHHSKFGRVIYLVLG